MLKVRPRGAAGKAATPPPADDKALRRARRRFARRQWARRWLAWRRVLAVLLVGAVVGGSVWLVLFSPVLAVSKVTIDGHEVLDPGEVRRTAAVPGGDPLATVDLGAVTARVETLAPVKSVDVSRDWPDGVRILLRERDAVAVVESGGRVRGVDAEGVVFRDFPPAPDDLPVVRMDPETEADALAEAASVISVLPAGLGARVDFVEVETIDTISLQLRDGRTIFWGSAEGSTSKAKVLEVLLQQDATGYDVSVPGQPTLRP